jgi:4-amino-4-deoxy-L-arabinose transferase-like glycosyltransferase
VRETRPWTLIVVAAACALVVWLIVRGTFTKLPPLPWTAVPALLILAIAEGFSGRNLRARIQGRRGGKPLAPIAVARMAALAKASSLAGAVFAGFGAGFLIYTLGSINKSVPGHDAISAGATLASAAVLVAAALYLEHSCRAPTPPDDEDRDGQPNKRGVR